MIKRTLFIGLIILCLLWAGWALGQIVSALNTTVIVNVTSDDGDANPGDGLCDIDLNTSGDQCSLRAAIEELNDLGPQGDPHLIQFEIPGDGPHTITPTTELPAITVPVEIDGVSQPGTLCPTFNSAATLMIVLDGRNAGVDAKGLILDTGSDGSVIRGLVIGNFDDDGIRINSDENRVRCNHIGIHADGVSPIGNNTGIFIGGSQNEIGGSNAHSARNVLSANQGYTFQLYGRSNRIVNNYIGTTANGMNELGNANGIAVSSDDNIIGGSHPLAGNIISGSERYGIYISQADNTQILGNYFGVARDGVTPLPNDDDGIVIYGNSLGTKVGGTGMGEGNIIAYSGEAGVSVQDSGSRIPLQNEIRGNAIHHNAELGIDLSGDGVDINDAGDGDEGANQHQNFPVLTATINSLVISATLESQPNTEYEVDFYRSANCDSSGYGEGEEYLVTVLINTDNTGQVTFNTPVTGAGAGDAITATATDPDGNTSEFSACVFLSQDPPSTHYQYLPLILQ